MRWPLASALVRVRDFARTVQIVNENVVGLRIEVQRALAPPPPRPPFVCALVYGTREDLSPLTCGAVGECKGEHVDLEMVGQITMLDPTVVVFCDLARVSVHGIFCGPNLMTAALGECPIVRFKRWDPGVRLRVQALVRKGYF